MIKMDTKILAADEAAVEKAAELIKNGEVVAMPTETVYGLAADAANEAAVAKIFEAKGRPQDNPLIVHICSFDMLFKVTAKVPEIAYKLAEKFWPGPLTMVLKKSKLIPDSVTGGLDTVGIRMPSHEAALGLIEKSGLPIAAPSANTSGKPSPTTAQHVYDDLNGKINLILDGGVCQFGVESTVIKVDDDTVTILRPGAVTEEMIEELGIKVKVSRGVYNELKSDEKVLSPGMKYKHYSPKANIVVVKSDFESFKKFAEKNIKDGTYFLIYTKEKNDFEFPCLTYGDTSLEQANELFGKLREFDKLGAKTVYARCPCNDQMGLAVYNRLLRAAGFEVIDIEQ